MDPETEQTPPALEPRQTRFDPDSTPAWPFQTQDPEEPYRGLKWVFSGPRVCAPAGRFSSLYLCFRLFASILRMLSPVTPPGADGGGAICRSPGTGPVFRRDRCRLILLISPSPSCRSLSTARSLITISRGPDRVMHFFSGARHWFRGTLCAGRSTGCRWMAALWPGRSARVQSPQIRRRVGRRVPSCRLR